MMNQLKISEELNVIDSYQTHKLNETPELNSLVNSTRNKVKLILGASKDNGEFNEVMTLIDNLKKKYNPRAARSFAAAIYISHKDFIMNLSNQSDKYMIIKHLQTYLGEEYLSGLERELVG